MVKSQAIDGESDYEASAVHAGCLLAVSWVAPQIFTHKRQHNIDLEKCTVLAVSEFECQPAQPVQAPGKYFQDSEPRDSN